MKVIIYHRIDSSNPSDSDRELMKGHLHRLELEADKHGYTVVERFYDFANGLSIERPGLGCLLDAVEDGMAEGILVSNLTRISRDGLTMDQIQKRLKSAGCTLLVVNDFPYSANACNRKEIS